MDKSSNKSSGGQFYTTGYLADPIRNRRTKALNLQLLSEHSLQNSMNNRILLLALFSLWAPGLLYGQLIDAFEDGDLDTDPTWIGDTAQFNVTEGELQSDGPAASSLLHTSTVATDIDGAEWRFTIKLEFDPSSTNYVRVYFVSNVSDLEGDVDGYYIQLGESSATLSDSIDIFRQDGSSSTKLFTSPINCINSSSENRMDFRILRDGAGNWELWADCEGAMSYAFMGSWTDATYTSTSWFGFFCRYSTASRADKYFFDDVYAGPEIVDTEAPVLNNIQVLAEDEIELTFNEALDPVSAAEVLNYSVDNGIGNPLIAALDGVDPSRVNLTFAAAFPPALTNTLSISDVADVSGNPIVLESGTFLFYELQPFDVVVTEFMPDETPVVSLPEWEFVELMNRSPITLDLTGWQIRDASASGVATFPSVSLDSGELLIICPTSGEVAYSAFGTTVGLSDWPSLNNDGDDIRILTESGFAVHEISYNDDWYQDADKAEGGWSVEMINPSNPTLGLCNWRASVSPTQGTPGGLNSVNLDFEDDSPPDLLGAIKVSDTTIRVTFSEAMDSVSMVENTRWLISPELGVPEFVLPEGPDYTTALLMVSPFPGVQAGVLYTLEVNDVTDCAGNPVGMFNTVEFGEAESPDSLDLIINEILYDPATGGRDYIEIFNRSDKILDLKPLFILEGDLENPGEWIDEGRLSEENRLILPGEYIALSEDAEPILAQFTTTNPSGVVTVPDMPSWPDSDNEGVVALQYRIGADVRTLDQVRYSEDWHFDLLDSEEGVSLERIDTEAPSQDENNWHSAASSIGFGTPAMVNSVITEGVDPGQNQVTVSPEVFSPDQDGVDDLLRIDYRFEAPGNVANITVYDSRGRPVRTLANNQLLEVQGFLTWDGTRDSGEKAKIAPYIVWVEVFNLNGETIRWKERCVLAGQLD